MVLSITLKDGSNVKYLLKSPQTDALEAARKEGISKEKVSSYRISQLGTALNIGESSLPLRLIRLTTRRPECRGLGCRGARCSTATPSKRRWT